MPVNPNEFSITHPSTNTKYNVLGIGEIIIPREPGLRIITWESWFPGSDDSPYVLTAGNFRDPEFLVDMFNGYKESQETTRLIVNRYDDQGITFDTNIQVTVEDFEIIEKGGEPSDIYYNVTLSEYRPYNAQVVAIVPTSTNTATAATTTQRATDTGALSVGDSVKASGTYYYDSYGASPTGKANNLTTTITRIVSSPKSGQSYPYHIGHYGWLTKGQLTKI